MKTLRCIVIEDEPLAQEVLKKYIADHPSLVLVAVHGNALSAQQDMANGKTDLLFLDINLPRLSGINFLKTLKEKPAVIFTTAYPEYAVEGFELDAIDYLVKPFSFERFLKAVNKVLAAVHPKEDKQEESIFVKVDKKLYRVMVDQITDIEAQGDYVKINTPGQVHLVNTSLKEIMDQLPANKFLRVHKSFAIALNKIRFLEGNYIRVDQKDIPIGATYREEVFNIIHSRK